MQIPYVKQEDQPGSQLCGAASLCMVYQSFGLVCSQAEVWENVSGRSRFSSRRAHTYRLAADALQRGLSALVLQARQPWAMLQRAHAHDIRIILNHRIKEGSSQGHFTVLVSIDEENAVLHDPQTGPDQAVPREKLLGLWKPTLFRSEVTGHVLVAIGAAGSSPSAACSCCGEVLPASLTCRACGREVPLHPDAILGCPGAECVQRLWDVIFCPFCDMRLDRVSS